MPDRPAAARTHLVELLTSMFSTSELLQFLDATHGPSLRTRLPENTIEPIELIGRTVALLERDGLIDDSLFEALQAVRPNRTHDILEVRRLYDLADPPGPGGLAGRSARPRRGARNAWLVVAVVEAVALAAIVVGRCRSDEVGGGADRSGGDAAMTAFACRRSTQVLEVIVNSVQPSAEQLVTEVRRHLERCKPLLMRGSDAQ